MSEELKAIVKEKYSAIARQGGSCCQGSQVSYSIFADSYDALQGHVADADLGLGCGLPTAFARIKPGDTVVDLGSGAGNDAFVALEETGASGRVIGIDFSEDMLAKARRNAAAVGASNVEFILGDIEAIPLPDATADVAVSNCVLNLVPNKSQAFAEIYRILKPGAHFSISDIVARSAMTESLRQDAELYAGCVSGALQEADYLQIIREAGFEDIEVQKARKVSLPADLLAKHLDGQALGEFLQADRGLFSLTVFARKPA